MDKVEFMNLMGELYQCEKTLRILAEISEREIVNAPMENPILLLDKCEEKLLTLPQDSRNFGEAHRLLLSLRNVISDGDYERLSDSLVPLVEDDIARIAFTKTLISCKPSSYAPPFRWQLGWDYGAELMRLADDYVENFGFSLEMVQGFNKFGEGLRSACVAANKSTARHVDFNSRYFDGNYAACYWWNSVSLFLRDNIFSCFHWYDGVTSEIFAEFRNLVKGFPEEYPMLDPRREATLMRNPLRKNLYDKRDNLSALDFLAAACMCDVYNGEWAAAML